MENTFDCSAFYEKAIFDSILKNPKLEEISLTHSFLSLNELKCVVWVEKLRINLISNTCNDMLAEGRIFSSRVKGNISDIMYVEQFGYDDDDFDDETITYLLKRLKQVKKIHPAFETFLSGLGIKKVEEFNTLISQEDINESDYDKMKEQIRNIKINNPNQIDLIYSLLIYFSEDKFEDSEILSDENVFEILFIFRAYDLFVKENYYEYQNWRNLLLNNRVDTFHGKSENYLLFAYYIITEMDIISFMFEELHSYITTSNRKNEILKLFKQERYASYIQGLYDEYCKEQNIPVASRFYFSDSIKTFTHDIITCQTTEPQSENEEPISSEKNIDVSCYRLKKPANFNVAELGLLYDNMSSFMSGGRVNFVFLFGGEISCENYKPINWTGKAEELIFFIRSLYRGTGDPEWSKVVHIFHHKGKEYKLTTLSNGKETENISITAAIKNCKS